MTGIKHSDGRSRTIDERLARLRRRLKEARDVDSLRAVMLGLLDLLDDELSTSRAVMLGLLDLLDNEL